MKPTNKFKMELFHYGDGIEQITNLVSKFNDGECSFTLQELSTYLKIRALLYPILSNAIMDVQEDGSAIVHTGDSSKPFLKITLNEYYELVQS